MKTTPVILALLLATSSSFALADTFHYRMHSKGVQGASSATPVPDTTPTPPQTATLMATTAVEFINVPEGTEVTQTITIQASGAPVTLNIQVTDWTGYHGEFLKVDGNCQGKVLQNSSCVETVRFTSAYESGEMTGLVRISGARTDGKGFASSQTTVYAETGPY